MSTELATTNGLMKTGKRYLIIGGVGAAYAIASDQYVDGMFQDDRGMDTSLSSPLYRALVQFTVGLLIGRLLWRFSRDAAMGAMGGGAVRAVMRVLDDADISQRLRDLVDGDRGNGAPRTTRAYVAPGTTPTPTTTPRTGSGLDSGRGAGSIHDDPGWTSEPIDNVRQMMRR